MKTCERHETSLITLNWMCILNGCVFFNILLNVFVWIVLTEFYAKQMRKNKQRAVQFLIAFLKCFVQQKDN